MRAYFFPFSVLDYFLQCCIAYCNWLLYNKCCFWCPTINGGNGFGKNVFSHWKFRMFYFWNLSSIFALPFFWKCFTQCSKVESKHFGISIQKGPTARRSCLSPTEWILWIWSLWIFHPESFTLDWNCVKFRYLFGGYHQFQSFRRLNLKK